MRHRFVLAVIAMHAWVLCASISFGAAFASEDGMRNARMNACIKILQRNDKAIRNGWRGHCGADELDQELAVTPEDPRRSDLLNLFGPKASVIVEDGSCTNPAPPPMALGPNCGLARPNLYSSLVSGASIRIRLPGNKCGAFIPLLLTNKTDFACNAVQTRIACVDVSHDESSDRTRLKFSARRTGSAETTTIEFGAAELAEHNGRISDLISHPQFMIVPEVVDRISVTKKILELTRSQEKNCNDRGRHSEAVCAKLSQFQADANMQEVLRRYRNPRHDSSKDAITRDGERIVEFLRARQIDKIQDQWILFLSIAANEVGLKVQDGGVTTYDPIYAVSDAVYGNSGLSFGAHQIDLGANEDREIQLFWDVIEAYKAQNHDATLDEAEIKKSCVDLPLRLMTVGALALTYRSTVQMTGALRSHEGFGEYNKRLLAYLDEEARATASLPGLFRKSLLARVLYSDLKNQVGSGLKVQKLADEQIGGGLDLNSCQNIVAAEDKILETLIYRDPADQARGKTQYADRYENVRRIVRGVALNRGIAGCT